MNPHPPVCDHLTFDATDNGDGTGTWEAMAGARTGDPLLNRIQAEMDDVVVWAGSQAPGPKGPPEEGGEWDADIGESFDAGWTTLTLTLTGPWAWGEHCIGCCRSSGGPGVA